MKRMLPFFLLFALKSPAQTIHRFENRDSLFAWTEQHSLTLKSADDQALLSRWTKISAVANTINFRNPVAIGLTDNTELPVSYLPGEVFGGPAGSFKAITLGQEYTGSIAITPQIDLINPSNWQRVRSATLNQELTSVNNLLTEKALLESVSAAYYNILSLQEQASVSSEMLAAADSLVLLMQNKVDQGILRIQNLNNAKINRLNLQDKYAQIQVMLMQQKLSLKILCAIPETDSLIIGGQITSPEFKPYTSDRVQSTLDLKAMELRSAYAKSELLATRLSSWTPTLSLIFNQGWQYNSNTRFFDANSKWVATQYVGLRLNFPFPPEAAKIAANKTAQINFAISQISLQQQQLQNDADAKIKELDYQKSIGTYATASDVLSLKQENYTRSQAQFKEDLLPPDSMLDAFTDLLNARLNYISSAANAWHQRSKIFISHLVQ